LRFFAALRLRFGAAFFADLRFFAAFFFFAMRITSFQVRRGACVQ
jgi:hypothetical protein